MKEKRCYLTRSTSTLRNNSIILNDVNFKSSTPYINYKTKVRKRSHDLSSNTSSSDMTSMNNFHEMIENVPPPISSRLRSRTSFKMNGYTYDNHKIDIYQSSESSGSSNSSNEANRNSQKKHKLYRVNSSLLNSLSSKLSTKNKPISKSQSVNPKKIYRSSSQMKSSQINYNDLPSTRYLLRSRSFKKACPLPIQENTEILFRAPDPPLKPLSEIYKKIITIPMDKNNSSFSQSSDISNNSSMCLSATLLSRFVKKKSKLPNAKSSKPWKQIRKIESSIEYNDSSSCTSVDDSLSTCILQTDSEQKILDLCDQTEIKSWCLFFEDLNNKTTNKIGEGVYGEVFRLNRGNVLKVFPVDGDVLVNGEDQMTFEDVFPEVFVSKKLTELNGKNKLFKSPNFVQLKKASMVRGKMPQVLIEQWKQFKNEKGTDNECLDFLSDKQKWMTLEYEFAGEPLSNYKFNSYNEVRSIIEQISLSLAVAEAAVQFEHRDLHWLNILVKPTRLAKIRYRINGTSYLGNSFGLFVTIIDFTVSRMCVDNNTVYMDMADCPEIFEGEGDYQFDIYRMMKNDNGNNWREFNPRSNLYWLHYLIDKLLHETSYPRGDPDSKSVEFESKQLFNRVLNYKSVEDLVEKDVYYEKCRLTNHCYANNDE